MSRKGWDMVWPGPTPLVWWPTGEGALSPNTVTSEVLGSGLQHINLLGRHNSTNNTLLRKSYLFVLHVLLVCWGLFPANKIRNAEYQLYLPTVTWLDYSKMGEKSYSTVRTWLEGLSLHRFHLLNQDKSTIIF